MIERYSSPMLGPEGKYLGRVWFFRDITIRKRADEEIRAAYEELAASEESLVCSYRDLLTSKQALQDSEIRLRSLIDNSEEAISMIDEEGRIIEWNPRSEQISGILKEEAIGMYLWDLTVRMAPPEHQDPEHRIEIEEAIRSSLRTGKPVFPGTQIITARRPDGTKIITRQKIFANQTERGYWFGSISHDITGEKEVENALRVSEERFREMAERSSDLILILNREMSPTYVSPSSRAIIGYEPEELVGKPPEFAAATIFSQSGPVLFEGVQKTMSGERVDNIELTICRKDGTQIIVNLSAVPTVHDEVVDGVQVSMRDITRAKKIEIALKESEEKFRLLADNVHDIIWTTDEKMHFTYISPSVTKFLGLTQEEATETTLGKLLTPESYQELHRYKKQWIETIQNNDKLPQNMEMILEFKRKDGSTVWTEIIMTMLYDNNKQLSEIVGVTRDISKRRQAEEALRKANRQLNLLSEITRHDIRNKITVIISYLALSNELITDPEVSGHMKKIEGATRTIKSLIEFTGWYGELGSTQPIWQNLAEILEQVHFPEQITPYINLQEYAVFADPMLEKVFYNLLDNAIRHGEKISTIQVSAEKDGDDLIVVWEDDGIGIAEEEKETIFHRGFGKNTGLGMFLVREILSVTDITIVENGKPGEGARFEMRIPRQSYRMVS